MTGSFPSIFQGHTYSTDEGDKFTVVDFDLIRGHVFVETREGALGVMEIEDMLQSVRAGELMTVLSDADGNDDEAR